MSEIIRYQDHMMIVADYKNPELHKHLALHIIISMDGYMQWQVDGEQIRCKAICIGSDVLHTGNTYGHQVLIFLVTPVSNFAYSMKQKYLKGKAYFVLDEAISDKISAEYKEFGGDWESLDRMILDACGLSNKENFGYDTRISEILAYLCKLETIDHFIIDDLCQLVCLSKSRLSHFFVEQTGITLHSYIAFEKLRKTGRYVLEGKNITESCLLAGFDSSSHCAATCKRMFGIALSEVCKIKK